MLAVLYLKINFVRYWMLGEDRRKACNCQAQEKEDGTMKFVITGGRDLNDETLRFLALSDIHQMTEITEVIHGGAKGADSLVAKWAKASGVQQTVSKPDWARFRIGAAVKNNQPMVDMQPDAVVAFPGGKGTADLNHRAEKTGLNIVHCRPENPTKNGI